MKIGLLGYGVIGKGVFQIIQERKDIQIKKILERPNRYDQAYLHLFTSDLREIINDQEIELVVEVLGGYDFASMAIKECLQAGKHVVTANKEVLAEDMPSLIKLAKEKNVKLAYEASVGGGIPIIKNLQSLIEVNKINKISGILNGTTNYILTKMHDGQSFVEALQDAKEKGFAESDPTADLEGYDMMRKIAILSNISWGIHVNLNNIYHQGITNITKEDIVKIQEEGKVLKFVCEAVKDNEQIKLSVKPTVFDKNHFFASVNNEFNAVILETTPNDKLIFIGKGAGASPTASAIVEDIMDIKNNYFKENYHINRR